MRGSGGTEGGIGQFFVGLILSIGALWFFFDSVIVTSSGWGIVSGLMYGFRERQGGGMQTASMGLIFVPFFLGVFSLFYDAKKMWAWALTYFGIFVIVAEILSRLQFFFSMKTTNLILIIVMFAAGTAFMFRSYRQLPQLDDPPPLEK